MTEFVAWAKTPRYFRDIVITEKIDGTNAAVIIDQVAVGDLAEIPFPDDVFIDPATAFAYQVAAQSRNRLITPESDNAGFAKWVRSNAVSLIADLGPGRHFGEWWGQGIQRKYSMDHKVFSLFNTFKWEDAAFATPNLSVVPVLYHGPHSAAAIEDAVGYLWNNGSRAAKSEGVEFPRAEGICIFHTASRQVFKVTLEDDESPKSLAA